MMIKMNVFILTVSMFLVSASSNALAKTDANNYKTMTVTTQTVVTPLYFTGTVKPLSMSNVVAPDDGVVVNMNFKYGQTVTKGQTLLKINSKKLEQDYDSALTNYLKAKDAYNMSVSKYKSTQALWDMKIIPEDELTSAKSSRDSAHIAYLQASYALEDTIKRGPSMSEDVKNLRLSDFEKVDKALRIRYNYLNVKSPKAGVALQPPKTGSGSQETGNINVGSSVKLGQVVTSIGDLNGISVDIKVNEIDINKVKLKQAVHITGVAFPGFKLAGHVSSIDSQATTQEGGSGGLPTFPVTVVVPTLTTAQAKVIRVGMSAKVELEISRPKDIIVPIKAVYKRKGKSYVNLLVNGKAEPREVITSDTTVSDVEIEHGLNNGDKVIINDPASN